MSEASPQLSVMRDWVALVCPIPVIFEDDPEPTAPRPDGTVGVPTYATVGFDDDDTATSTAYEETTDEDAGNDLVNQYRSETTFGSLGVEFYGPGSVDFARTLRLSIARPDVLVLLNAAGDYAINKAGPVSDDPILRSASREPHASISFDVQWVESKIYKTEAVESIVPTVDIEQE